MIGLVSLIGGLAWYCKILFGMACDYFPIKKYRTKYYLYINYLLLIALGIYVIIFGYNLMSLILVTLLANIAIGWNDVANDTQMVKLEQKYDLKGKIQAIQWTSLGIVGLFVSVVGAWIAKTFTEPLNYKIATAIWIILPIITLLYLIKYYKEKPIKKRKNFEQLKASLSHFKNKAFLIGLLFIFCFNFSPSFGTALMIKMRETMSIGKMFIGYLGATGTVIGLIGYILYYWKAYKFPLKKLLIFAITFSALTNLCYLYLPNKWILVVYNILFGAFGGIIHLTILNFFVKLVPKGAEGLFFALIASVYNLAGKLGVFFGGVIFDALGYNWNVIIATITTLMCLWFIPNLKLKSNNLCLQN